MDDKLRQRIEAKIAEYEQTAQTLLMQSNMNYAAAEALKDLLEPTDEAGEIPPAVDKESEAAQDES